MKNIIIAAAVGISAVSFNAQAADSTQACGMFENETRFNPTSLSDYQECWLDFHYPDKMSGTLGSLFWVKVGDEFISMPVKTLVREGSTAKAQKLVVDAVIEKMLRDQLEIERALILELRNEIDTLQSLVDGIPALQSRIDDLVLQLAVAEGRIAEVPQQLADEYNRGYDQGVIDGRNGYVTVTFADDQASMAFMNGHSAGFQAGQNDIRDNDPLYRNEDGHSSTITNTGIRTEGLNVFVVTGEVPTASTGRFVRAESYENAVAAWNIQRDTALRTEARLIDERDAAIADADTQRGYVTYQTDLRNSLFNEFRTRTGADILFVNGRPMCNTNCSTYSSLQQQFTRSEITAAAFIDGIVALLPPVPLQRDTLETTVGADGTTATNEEILLYADDNGNANYLVSQSYGCLLYTSPSPRD